MASLEQIKRAYNALFENNKHAFRVNFFEVLGKAINDEDFDTIAGLLDNEDVYTDVTFSDTYGDYRNDRFCDPIRVALKARGPRRNAILQEILKVFPPKLAHAHLAISCYYYDDYETMIEYLLDHDYKDISRHTAVEIGGYKTMVQCNWPIDKFSDVVGRIGRMLDIDTHERSIRNALPMCVTYCRDTHLDFLLCMCHNADMRAEFCEIALKHLYTMFNDSRLNILKVLHKHGINVSVSTEVNDKRCYLLSTAIHDNLPETTKWLLENKARITRTLFLHIMRRVKMPSVDSVKILIDYMISRKMSMAIIAEVAAENHFQMPRDVAKIFAPYIPVVWNGIHIAFHYDYNRGESTLAVILAEHMDRESMRYLCRPLTNPKLVFNDHYGDGFMNWSALRFIYRRNPNLAAYMLLSTPMQFVNDRDIELICGCANNKERSLLLANKLIVPNSSSCKAKNIAMTRLIQILVMLEMHRPDLESVKLRIEEKIKQVQAVKEMRKK